MDRDEIEEQMNAAPLIPLIQPANSNDVKVARIQCAKIVRRGTDHAVRYRRKRMWMRILKYSYPDLDIDVNQPPDVKREWPRPIRSPFPCWNCHRRFQGPPIFMPRQMLDRRVEEHGNFCSAPCVNTFIRDHPNANSAAIAAELYTYMRTVHGFTGAEIGFAPRFDQHDTYGGDEDDAAFDEIIGNPNLTTTVLLVPYIPGDSVVEWKYNAGTDAELVQLPPFAYIPANTATGGAGTLAGNGSSGGGSGNGGTGVGGHDMTGGRGVGRATHQQQQQATQSAVARAALDAYIAKHGQEAAAHVPGLVHHGGNANDAQHAAAQAFPPAGPGAGAGAPAPPPAMNAVSVPMQYLAAVMRAAPQPTGDEDPVHDTKHIRQKPLAETQKRLMELPPQEQRVSEYDLFLARHPMDAEENLSDDDPLPPPPPKKTSKSAKKKGDASAATAARRSVSNAPALKASNAAAFLPTGLTTAELVAHNMHARLLPGGAATTQSKAKAAKPRTKAAGTGTGTKKAKTVTFAPSVTSPGSAARQDDVAAPGSAEEAAPFPSPADAAPMSAPVIVPPSAAGAGAPKRTKTHKRSNAPAASSDSAGAGDADAASSKKQRTTAADAQDAA